MVKAFALVFVLTLDKQNAINFQLLGGIWILQTFPAIVFSLYTRWFHRWALLAGWAVGMVYGTVAAYSVINPATGKHFGGSLADDPGDRPDGLHRADGVRAQRASSPSVLSAVLAPTKVVQRRRRDRVPATTSPTPVTRGWRRTRPPGVVEETDRTSAYVATDRSLRSLLDQLGDDHGVGAGLEVPGAAALGAGDLAVRREIEVLAGDGDLAARAAR